MLKDKRGKLHSGMRTLAQRLGAAAFVLLLSVGMFAFPMTAQAASEGEAPFVLSQNVLSDVTPDTTAFSYELRAQTAGAPLPEGAAGDVYQFTMAGQTVESFTIAYPAAGEFLYSLRCIGGEGTEAYDVDQSEYILKAYAKEEGGVIKAYIFLHASLGGAPGGKLNADPTQGGTYLFTHEKKEAGGPDPFIIVDPPVRKTIEGTPDAEDEFRFRLRAREWPAAVEVVPMPEGSTGTEKVMSIFGEGVEDFGTWAYEAVGTYVYDISEINTNNPDYEYDRKMFTITDEVTLVDNAYSVRRTIIDSNGTIVQNTLVRPGAESAAEVRFVNKYIGEAHTPTPTKKATPTPVKRTGSTGRSSRIGGSSRTKPVKTGDETNAILWILVMLAAASGVCIVLRRGKK